MIERAKNRPTTVDWSRGLIIARGAAAGDVRAPSPSVARVAARRRATEQARNRLIERAQTLVLDAKTIAKHARADKQVAKRLRQSAQQALELGMDYGSDGSMVATVGLPLEAVRSAVHGPTRVTRAADQAPTAIVVDARRVMNRPILGVELASLSARYVGPAVFYRSLTRALADPRAGQRIVQVRAKKRSGARLVMSAPAAAARSHVEAAARAGALLIIVIGK